MDAMTGIQPVELEIYEDIYYPDDWIVQTNGGRELIARRVHGERYARLFVASPAMQKALEMLIAWEDGTHDTSPTEQHCRAVAAARAALAIAKTIAG